MAETEDPTTTSAKPNQCFLYIMMLMMLIFGTANTIVQDYQN